MNVLVHSVGLFFAGFFLHIVLWKIHLPKRQTRTLLILFFSLLFLDQVTISLFWYERIQIIVTYVALVLGYIITYSALEADSPSLVIILNIFSRGEKGFPVQEMEALADDKSLIVPRVNDLVRDQMVTLSGNRYKLTGKGKRFIYTLIYYRRLLGASRGG